MMSRRAFLKRAAGITALTGVGAWAWRGGALGQGPSPRRVSGAGAQLVGPLATPPGARDPFGNPVPPQAFLLADFGFDETFLFWKIATNPDAPFVLPTAAHGPIEVGLFQFFLGIQSVEISSLTAETAPDGSRRARLEGTGRSVLVLPREGELRRFEGPIRFILEAIDRGTPGPAVGDAVRLTVDFDPEGEQAKIFGPRSTLFVAEEGALLFGNVAVEV